MNVTVYSKALRFIVQSNDGAVSDLYKQYLELVELLVDTTVTAVSSDFIIETVLRIIGRVPTLPEYSKAYISKVGDSLVFVFLKDHTVNGRMPYITTWERKRPMDWCTLRPVYAVIFTGLSNIK